MIGTGSLLDSGVMAVPRPLPEVAAEFGVSRSTLWTWIRDLGLTRYRMPGAGKQTYLDPDEVRRKLKPVPKTKG
jgi:transposase-like protein